MSFRPPFIQNAVLWSLQDLENVGRFSASGSIFLRRIDFARYEDKCDFIVDLKQLHPSAHFNDASQDWIKRSTLRDAAPVREAQALL
ncbi:hypothetical protein SynA1544_03198 [Synechococcus sp. A15-44]|nr:hypothetical protein SynA1544_03198 [Synechococcus sp. A15-44]